MSIAECVIAVQSSSESHTINPPYARYLVIALVAVVLGVVVLIFIRTIAGRSSKR
jgi:branched-subunit amino acid ABC-type transport system permease component